MVSLGFVLDDLNPDRSTRPSPYPRSTHPKLTTDTPTHDAQSEEYLGKLNAITGRLAGSFPGEPLGREDVARVVMELLQGQEETLGANSPSPRPMVKLSMRHWQDYTPGGSLFMIVRRCVRFKLKKGLRRFDWQSEHKRAEFVGMLGDCAEELREKGLLGHVVVYISGDVPAESRELIKASARSMGACAVRVGERRGGDARPPRRPRRKRDGNQTRLPG